ncbi:MAG TPA: Ger(x)C family spore germination protein [Bacilli bacterium]|nr:Ger(x)C family spore germination protein [Bacilli bacterium]
MSKHTLPYKCLLLLLSTALLVTGCARRNVLEDLGLTLSVGYDMTDDGKILVTAAMPEVSQEAQEKVEIIASKGDLSKEARSNLGLSTDRKVVSGQLRTAIFSEKLARQGIWQNLDTLLRDVNITSALIVCISDDKAHDILSTKYPDRPNIGRYVFDLLRKEQKNYTVPKTTIEDFARRYYDRMADPVAPYLQLEVGHLKAAGTALFREDKYVGSLSPEETKMLMLLSGKGEGGDIKQTLKTSKGKSKPDQILMTFVRATNDYEVKSQKGKKGKRDKTSITFNVKVSGQVVEYSGEEDLLDPTVKTNLEKQISEGLRSRMEDLIDQLQHKYKSDPLGIGGHIRAQHTYKEWTREIWRREYENAKIKVNFDFEITRPGVIK